MVKRGGLEGTAVAGEIEPMAKPTAWFSQRHGSEGAGLAVSGASAVTERRGEGERVRWYSCTHDAYTLETVHPGVHPSLYQSKQYF